MSLMDKLKRMGEVIYPEKQRQQDDLWGDSIVYQAEVEIERFKDLISPKTKTLDRTQQLEIEVSNACRDLYQAIRRQTEFRDCPKTQQEFFDYDMEALSHLSNFNHSTRIFQARYLEKSFAVSQAQKNNFECIQNEIKAFFYEIADISLIDEQFSKKRYEALQNLQINLKPLLLDFIAEGELNLNK